MRIVIKRRILDYAKQHPNASASLSAWVTVFSAAKWQSITDVRKVFPHADLANDQCSKTVTIFNIAGHPLTVDQADYLETLSALAKGYESANYPAPPSQPPHEFLSAHLGNIGMTATEWGKLIGIDRSTASRLPPPASFVASANSTPATLEKLPRLWASKRPF